MYRIFGIVFLLIVAVGCKFNNSEIVRFYDDGREKPTIAIAPVIEKVSMDLPWSVSNELTEKIYTKLQGSGEFYFPSNEAVLSHLAGRPDLLSSDMEFLNEVTNAEFIVLTELIDHQEVEYHGQKIKPVYPKDGKIGSVIMMKLRVKVLDLRGGRPRVVLQEIINSNHLVGIDNSFISYDDVKWGMPAYKYTPLNMAHARLANDVAKHLKTYVGFAKRSVI